MQGRAIPFRRRPAPVSGLPGNEQFDWVCDARGSIGSRAVSTVHKLMGRSSLITPPPPQPGRAGMPGPRAVAGIGPAVAVMADPGRSAAVRQPVLSLFSSRSVSFCYIAGYPRDSLLDEK